MTRAKATTEVGTTAKTVEAEAAWQAQPPRKAKTKSAEIDIERALFNLAMILQLKDFQNFDVQEFPSFQTCYQLRSILQTVLLKRL